MARRSHAAAAGVGLSSEPLGPPAKRVARTDENQQCRTALLWASPQRHSQHQRHSSGIRESEASTKNAEALRGRPSAEALRGRPSAELLCVRPSLQHLLGSLSPAASRIGLGQDGSGRGVHVLRGSETPTRRTVARGESFERLASFSQQRSNIKLQQTPSLSLGVAHSTGETADEEEEAMLRDSNIPFDDLNLEPDLLQGGTENDDSDLDSHAGKAGPISPRRRLAQPGGPPTGSSFSLSTYLRYRERQSTTAHQASSSTPPGQPVRRPSQVLPRGFHQRPKLLFYVFQ